MDRYIVHNAGSVDGHDTQQVQDQVQVDPSASTSTAFIIQASGSKVLEQTVMDTGYGQPEADGQYTAKTLDTSQFNDGVDNTTYIIDNNSSNSIDSVRIGNHSFVPVVDSPLYNISVAGTTAQYTIEGVVNPGLGNYIIEGPAYIVEAKPTVSGPTTQTMYIQHAPSLQGPPQIQTQPQIQALQGHEDVAFQVADVVPIQAGETTIVVKKLPEKRQTAAEKKAQAAEKKKKAKEEAGPFFCLICNAEFNSSASLRFHSYHHNPKSKRFSCIGCEKAFEKDKEKEEHELQCDVNYTVSKFQCIFCDLPYNTPKQLRTHENKHRPVKKTKKYKHMCVCIKCNKAFDAIYTLKVHIKKLHGGNASPDKKKKKKKEVFDEVEQYCPPQK